MDLRRFIIVVAAIFVVVVLAVLIFGHGSKQPANPAITKNLPDYADSALQVQYTTDGVINGDDAHRQIVITISNTSRVLTINGGYQGKVLQSETFDNNVDAYRAFLSALYTSGFTKVRKSKITSEAGQCPLGQRFIYEVTNSNQNDLRTWSTSCGGAETFGGQAATVQQLFQLQFSNYDDFTADVSL